MIEDKVGIRIFAPSLHFSSFRLPNYTALFGAELVDMILTLQKVPHSFSKVILLTDVLSVCSSRAKGVHSVHFAAIARLVPVHIKSIRIVWVPGHVPQSKRNSRCHIAVACGLCPGLWSVTEVLPLIEYFFSSRYRRSLEF